LPQDEKQPNASVATVKVVTEVPPVASETPTAPEDTSNDTAPEEEKPKKNWKENFNVKECVKVETIDRLDIMIGVNEYKGSTMVFAAKVTDKDFSRQFFSLPAYVWQKVIVELSKILLHIAEIEKKSMSDAVVKELQRLKDLGIDISSLVKKANVPTTKA